jgi:hypothetical protein
LTPFDPFIPFVPFDPFVPFADLALVGLRVVGTFVGFGVNVVGEVVAGDEVGFAVVGNGVGDAVGIEVVGNEVGSAVAVCAPTWTTPRPNNASIATDRAMDREEALIVMIFSRPFLDLE